MSLMVPVGAVVTRVYFTVPEHYDIGQEYATWLEAAEVAIAKRDAEVQQHFESYRGYFGDERAMEIARKTAKTHCNVDERWTMKWEQDGVTTFTSGVDQTMQRTNVDYLDAEHFERVRARSVTV